MDAILASMTKSSFDMLNIVTILYEQRISSDKASNLPKRDVRFILMK